MSGQLKEVRERIQSVNSTQQITNAMKMVSAAKLRRAQTAITEIRPYSDKLDGILRNILSNLDGGADSQFGVEREGQKTLIIVITSNRGLAGAFNSNIIKACVHKIETDCKSARSNGELSILCVGKKGYEYFKKRYSDCNIISDYVNLFADLSFESVAQVSQLAMDGFEAKEYDHVYVGYGRFKNAAVQYSELTQFLPVQKIEPSSTSKRSLKSDYIFEPNQDDLLRELIPTILQTSFHKMILDTHASEHGARMTAMSKATDNAQELMKELRITYNKARQEAITKELSEIVGGAAALG